MTDPFHGPNPHEVVAERFSTVQVGPQLRDSPQIHQATSQPPRDFNMEQLDSVIARLKNNKAPGSDEVTAEIILLLNYWGQQELLKIINHCFREQKVVPQSWKEALIVSIVKGMFLTKFSTNVATQCFKQFFLRHERLMGKSRINFHGPDQPQPLHRHWES